MTGRMAEWSNAAVLKTAEPETAPGVRIPLLPPLITFEATESLVSSSHLSSPASVLHWNVDEYLDFFRRGGKSIKGLSVM